VEQIARRSAARAARWIIRWRIQNSSVDALALEAAWLPHGQFRGERTDLEPPISLPPGQATELELPVAWDEPVGSIVENAFLLLTVRWRGEPWRILTRITVYRDADGTPDARTQSMTVQKVGFSQA
jgi:hypothetical protein